MSALLLHPSVAVGKPSGLKNCCSPLAMETNLDRGESKAGEGIQESAKAKFGGKGDSKKRTFHLQVSPILDSRVT